MSGVISSSITSSRSPSSSTTSVPMGVPAASTMMPLWSSPSPSSRSEQIMPSDMRPYVLRAPTSNPPGSTPPGSTTGTRSPTAKLVAPQTISRGVASPTSTLQCLIGFLKPVSSSISSTSPTTTFLTS